MIQTIASPCITLYSGKPSMGTLANSDNPDEMQLAAAFHQGLHCLLRFNEPLDTENTS